MSGSFTEDLEHAFRAVACALTSTQLELVSRARDLNIPLSERNRLLAETVAAYRAGQRATWGPVLLELAAPALLETLERFRPRPPLFDPEDLKHLLVAQFLHAAATMRIPPDGRYLKAELVARARRAVGRRLAREGRHQSWHQVLDDIEGLTR